MTIIYAFRKLKQISQFGQKKYIKSYKKKTFRHHLDLHRYESTTVVIICEKCYYYHLHSNIDVYYKIVIILVTFP